MSERAPWYARMVGVPLGLFGVGNGIGYFLLPPDQLGSSTSIALNIGGSLVAIIAGIGLIASRRWGWAVALAATLLILGTGLVAFLAPPDVAFPGADLTALAFLVLPSLAGLAALLAPPTLRWVARRAAPRSAPTAGSASPPQRPDPIAG